MSNLNLSRYNSGEITAFNVKICPDSTDQLVTGEILYEFWQNKNSIDNKEKQCALIRVSKDKLTFILNYYSHNDGVQITKSLPISDLQQAVIDLRGAGFK